LWFIYEPIELSDTGTYIALAQRIATMNFDGFDGFRTPGYPLLLLLGGQNQQVVWLLQSLLGIATALFLFGLTLRQTGSRLAALIAALGCGLSINLIFSEASILTEALSAFLIVVTVFLCAALSTRQASDFRSSLALGCVVSLAGLTRPLLLLLIPLCLLFLLLRPGTASDRRTALGFLLPPALLIGGWSAVVWNATGWFTPTISTGYSLTRHSGAFFELVPDEDAQLRDIYLRHRAAAAETNTSPGNTIWQAKDEMRQATGLNAAALSKELTRISLALFAAHPRLYLQSVGQAWRKFWESKIVWQRDRISDERLRETALWLWGRQWTLLRAAKRALLPALLLYVVYIFAGQSRIAAVPLLSLAVIGSASLVQALLEYGENDRYALPFQPLIVFVVVAAIFDAARLFGWRPR